MMTIPSQYKVSNLISRTIYIIVSIALATTIPMTAGFNMDLLQDSPNVYQLGSSKCISISKNGKMEISQDFGVFMRKVAINLLDAEPFDALGHELCISDGFLIKSSGPIGVSSFDVEYQYTPPIIVNTAITPLLLRMRADLPNFVSMYFKLQGVNINAPSTSEFSVFETYKLDEFMEQFTYYTLAPFANLNGTYQVNKLGYHMLPAENNIDLRLSYPSPVRANYLQYRAVTSYPSDTRAMLAVDGNVNTTWRVFENTPANLTINFPAIRFTRSIIIRWKAPPASVTLGYYDSSNMYIQIQKWNNQIPIMKTARRNNPVLAINNLVLTFTGFAVLSEVEYT